MMRMAIDPKAGMTRKFMTKRAVISSKVRGQQTGNVFFEFLVAVGLKDNPAAELFIVELLSANLPGAIQGNLVEVGNSGEVAASCVFTVFIRYEFEEVNDPARIAVDI